MAIKTEAGRQILRNINWVIWGQLVHHWAGYARQTGRRQQCSGTNQHTNGHAGFSSILRRLV